MTDSLIARMLYKIILNQVNKLIKGKEDTPMSALMRVSVQEMPLRIMLMSGGQFDHPKLEALLMMINGHFFKGLKAFIKAGSKSK